MLLFLVFIVVFALIVKLKYTIKYKKKRKRSQAIRILWNYVPGLKNRYGKNSSLKGDRVEIEFETKNPDWDVELAMGNFYNGSYQTDRFEYEVRYIDEEEWFSEFDRILIQYEEVKRNKDFANKIVEIENLKREISNLNGMVKALYTDLITKRMKKGEYDNINEIINEIEHLYDIDRSATAVIIYDLRKLDILLEGHKTFYII